MMLRSLFKQVTFLWLGMMMAPICLLAQSHLVPSLVHESIFPLQAKHTHASSIVALPGGDLLSVWFEGSGERKSDDVLLMGSRKKQGQTKWSKPFEMADTPGIPDCNPVLFLNQREELFLVWIAVNANEWENSILRLKRSKSFDTDGAPIWNWQDNIFLKPGDEFAEEVARKFKDLPPTHLGWSSYAPEYEEMIIEASQDSKKTSMGWMTRIKPLVTEDRILLPLYSDGFNFSLMAISDDMGESWKPSLPLVGKGPIQPALIQKENGDIVAMLRDAGDAPSMIQQSISKDQGETWTVAKKTEFPNTASVELLKLKDGRWWMVGNDIQDGRYQLALWISSDEGNVWSNPQYLELDSTHQGKFSYPALIQDKEGLVHLTYSKHLNEGKTIQYRLLDPNQIH
ncbi:exo-alpha-sialidase [Algoriphagus sp. D3-2-R+10]|uniref:sialidase family protein n=1 Tax=Algoriphagus aurantiacus TaxID=3103948 RepID=UPI002B3D4E80|nr:exo-alpha-sialidase [Algoriphagus sp. D3-2-R+10]MEB2777556.1 exo-alpha-sialidase [Algoriphagus sp. D3-2-R+10]